MSSFEEYLITLFISNVVKKILSEKIKGCNYYEVHNRV